MIIRKKYLPTKCKNLKPIPGSLPKKNKTENKMEKNPMTKVFVSEPNVEPEKRLVRHN